MENRIIVLFFMLAALSFLFTGVSVLVLRLRSKYSLRILPVFWCLLFLIALIPVDSGKNAVEFALYTDYTGGLRVELHDPAETERPADVPDVYLPHGVLRAARGFCLTLLLFWFVAATASFTFGLAAYFDGMQYLTRHSAVCRDERVNRIFASAKTKVGIRRNIPLRIMKPEVRISPCTCGILFPSVYIGGDCPDDYSDLWLELIFMHELTHIRHWDTLTKLLTLFTTSFHILLPTAKVIRNAVCEDLEYLCDEAVLDKTGDRMRGEYIAMILNMAERNLREDWQGAEILSYLSPGGNAILRRYRNMKERHDRRRNIARAVPVLLLGALLNLGMMSAGQVRNFDNLGVDLANPVLRETVCGYFGLNDAHELTEEHLRQIYCIEFSRPGFPEERKIYAVTLNEGNPQDSRCFSSDSRVMDTRDIVLFGGLRTLIFSDLTESSVEEWYETTKFAVIRRDN